MPSLEENKKKWAEHHWSMAGDEWSTLGGGSDRWWHGILLPRVLPLLNALPEKPHVLEIAPGHGRWTQYLLHHAHTLTVVDIDQGCLDACRERFGDRVKLVLGDGRTLGDINGPIDLCFSYDSLVHAEMDVMGPYIAEIARVLRPGGFAFIHHSNLADLQLPEGAPRHWRARTVNAELVRTRAIECGLAVPMQELCTKAGPKDKAMIDCISVLRKPGGEAVPEGTTVLESPGFGQQIRLLGRAGRAYDAIIETS